MNQKQRLTIRNSDGTVSQPTKTTFEKALYRLAEYEDLGYTPEELKQILSKIDCENQISSNDDEVDFPSELFEFLMYISIARCEADITHKDISDFCSNATQSDIDNLRSIYNQFNERVDSVPDQTTACDVSDLICEVKKLVFSHRYKDGDIVKKVYILCKKKNIECDRPGKCADCMSNDFCAHISTITYAAEKEDVLRQNCFDDRSSSQCRKAFRNLKHTVDLIKNVMDSKDRIKATVQYAYQDGGRLKARMSVTIGNKYVVHDVKVYDDPQNGLSVVMPMIRQKSGDSYVPVSAFHALDSETSNLIKNKVLEACKDYLEGD